MVVKLSLCETNLKILLMEKKNFLKNRKSRVNNHNQNTKISPIMTINNPNVIIPDTAMSTAVIQEFEEL